MTDVGIKKDEDIFKMLLVIQGSLFSRKRLDKPIWNEVDDLILEMVGEVIVLMAQRGRIDDGSLLF